MDDDLIVTADVVIDTVMQALGRHCHRLAPGSAAQVLTVAVVAAKDFRHHHELALPVRRGMR